MATMHVMHLETGRNLFGGGRQVLLLAGGLDAHSVRSTVVCAAGGGLELAARARGLEVESLPVGGDLDVTLALRLYRLLGRLKPDLLHIHSRRGADTFGLLAGRWAGIPLVLTRRVDNPETRAWGDWKYQRSDRVIAISAGIESALQRFGVPAGKLRKVTSAVDPAEYQPTWPAARFRHEFELDDDHRVLGMVAQMIPRKGHRQLLRILPRLRAACPEARVVLFGTGRLEPQLREWLRNAGLSAMVRFAGFRLDLPAFLGHLELLIHPATREGLGVGLLEAQAAGVPVVAYDIPGVREAVANGVSGLLATDGDSDELASAVMRLLWDPRLRQQLAAGARGHVREHFGVEQMVAGNLAVYRELLPGSSDGD